MTNEQTHEKLKQIKQSFRLLMSGPTSMSMREKGLDYKINWGVQLNDLIAMAQDIGKDYHLAIALWKEDIRECKILATLIMPADEMPAEVTDIWMEQTRSLEIAEMASFHLYQHLPYAAQKAYQWIAAADDIPQICGYHILARLFRGGQEPNERGIHEYIDNVLVALQSQSLAVRKAALASINRFADMGLVYERMAKSALKQINLELF